VIWDVAAAGMPLPSAPPPVPPPPPARVVNMRREPAQVDIGRPGPWGNPYRIGPDGDRETVIAKYSVWIRSQPALMAALPGLRGKVLGCWCKPAPCHGDILVALAEGREPPARMPAVPRMNAWQYAEQAKALTYDSDDAEFVRDLDWYAEWVGRKRGLPLVRVSEYGRLQYLWPEEVWRDVLDTMAQRGAESGTWKLDEDELDAIAEGHLPDRENRSRPTVADWAAQDEHAGRSFWSYPAPPEGTQAYYDWCAMADGQAARDARQYRYRHSGDPAWESADGDPEGYGDPYESRDAGLGGGHRAVGWR